MPLAHSYTRAMTNQMDLGLYHVLKGSTGQLLVAAVKDFPHENTRQGLAESAGLSVFAAGRATTTLINLGLLAEGRRGVVWNPEHPWAAELERAVRLTTGISRDSGRRRDFMHSDLEWTKTEWVEKELPPSLRYTRREGLTPVAGSGPDSHVSRMQADAINQIRRHAGSVVEALHTAYSKWRYERFRDAIHATGDWDSDLYAATIALDRTAGKGTATTGWVRAIYWLVRLRRHVNWWVTTLDQSVLLGKEYRSLLTGPTGIAGESTEADQLMEKYRGRLWWIGGMPGRADIGQSGDQLMAALADGLLAHIEQVLRGMTEDAAFQSWVATFPEEAAAYPIPSDSTRLTERTPAALPSLAEDHA